VALKDTRIIAAGEDVAAVQQSAEKKNVKGYILHFVPSHRLALVQVKQSIPKPAYFTSPLSKMSLFI
jgi:hypothetical protein